MGEINMAKTVEAGAHLNLVFYGNESEATEELIRLNNIAFKAGVYLLNYEADTRGDPRTGIKHEFKFSGNINNLAEFIKLLGLIG